MRKKSKKIIYKYSKSSSFYASTKNELFIDNTQLLKKAKIQNKLYASQPLRKKCKLCLKKLPPSEDFNSHGVSYVFCSNCSHMNGCHEDTESFITQLYINDEGADYAKNYIDKNFLKRVKTIYIPKVDFLIKSLPSVPKKNYKILDIGCGSGYFVCAAQIKNLVVHGIDVSKKMVDFGNFQISNFAKNQPLTFTNELGFYEHIVNTDADIVSAIGVIEHLREPHKFFDAFRKSKARYLYYSVPMFSLSVIIENMFKDVFPRQLVGGHTHLFTEESIGRMNEIIGVKAVAEWRFGTDVMDLYRSTIINLQKNNVSQKIKDEFTGKFVKIIDKIQNIIDKSHFCSEIHSVNLKKDT